MAAIIALIIVRPPGATAHGAGGELFCCAEKLIMPYAANPPTVDGVIGPTEYSAFGQWTEAGEGLQVSLAHNDSVAFLGVRQPGTGWVGIALANDVSSGANVVLAVRNGTSVRVSDNFAANVTDEMASVPDDTLGGTFDVLGSAATSSGNGTTYEFAIPWSSADSHDQQWESGVVYPFAVAFNETAQDLPSALNEGDVHFLRVYVARATDDLKAIQNLFMGNPSPVPPLVAMGVFSVGTGTLAWRYLSPRKKGEKR